MLSDILSNFTTNNKIMATSSRLMNPTTKMYKHSFNNNRMVPCFTHQISTITYFSPIFHKKRHYLQNQKLQVIPHSNTWGKTFHKHCPCGLPLRQSPAIFKSQIKIYKDCCLLKTNWSTLGHRWAINSPLSQF